MHFFSTQVRAPIVLALCLAMLGSAVAADLPSTGALSAAGLKQKAGKFPGGAAVADAVLHVPDDVKTEADALPAQVQQEAAQAPNRLVQEAGSRVMPPKRQLLPLPKPKTKAEKEVEAKKQAAAKEAEAKKQAEAKEAEAKKQAAAKKINDKKVDAAMDEMENQIDREMSKRSTAGNVVDGVDQEIKKTSKHHKETKPHDLQSVSNLAHPSHDEGAHTGKHLSTEQQAEQEGKEAAEKMSAVPIGIIHGSQKVQAQSGEVVAAICSEANGVGEELVPAVGRRAEGVPLLGYGSSTDTSKAVEGAAANAAAKGVPLALAPVKGYTGMVNTALLTAQAVKGAAHLPRDALSGLEAAAKPFIESAEGLLQGKLPRDTADTAADFEQAAQLVIDSSEGLLKGSASGAPLRDSSNEVASNKRDTVIIPATAIFPGAGPKAAEFAQELKNLAQPGAQQQQPKQKLAIPAQPSPNEGKRMITRRKRETI